MKKKTSWHRPRRRRTKSVCKSHVRRSPSSAARSPMRCATLSVILPAAAALQPAVASTLAAAATAADALSKLLETNWASCSILAVVGATLARDVAPRHRRHSPSPFRIREDRFLVFGGRASRHRRRDAHTRRPRDAIRPLANPRANGRARHASRCLSRLLRGAFTLSLSSPRNHHLRARATSSFISRGAGVGYSTSKPTLISICAFPPAAKTLAGKTNPLSPLAGRERSVARFSDHVLLCTLLSTGLLRYYYMSLLLALLPLPQPSAFSWLPRAALFIRR